MFNIILYNKLLTLASIILTVVVLKVSVFPVIWNDKTTVLYDDFICGGKEGDFLTYFDFGILEYGRYGNIFKRKYMGPWFIPDNGYL